MTAPDAPTRRTRLRAVKLRALVREHLGGDVGGADADAVFPPGAALVDAEGAAWVLVEEGPERGLGPALAWAHRHGARSLHLLAERETGLLARRAACFDLPVSVWHVADRRLVPAVAEPLTPPPRAAAAHRALIPMIEAGGAEPIVEHGVVAGEVRGLEVCRVVNDRVTGAVRLEVGVGVHDREAFAIIHGDVPATDALRGVVDAVVEHRQPGAVEHPLSRLVPERLVRWSLEQRPGSLGLVDLVRVEPPTPRPNVKDRVPCSALGHRPGGEPVVVVCSVGVDLDVIPYAADARLAAARSGLVDPETIVVVPARDMVPITIDLAGLVTSPITVHAIP